MHVRWRSRPEPVPCHNCKGRGFHWVATTHGYLKPICKVCEGRGVIYPLGPAQGCGHALAASAVLFGLLALAKSQGVIGPALIVVVAVVLYYSVGKRR